MTRMRFGLNVALKIMSKIIDKVLSLDEQICNGTDHYIDDIWVNEEVVQADVGRAHLLRFGLVAKDPLTLSDTCVLGLRVNNAEDDQYNWKRDGDLPVVSENVTKRDLFSICGKLVGHYPVAGWLRVACSYVKRLTNDIDWSETVPSSVKSLLDEVFQRVQEQDPVRDKWDVKKTSQCTVWCDASNLALGVSLEVDGYTVEDAAWLRREDDGAHINVAELEAALKGINLALAWKMTNVQVITGSATVYGWKNSVIEDTKRPKVTGLSELIIRRRLGIIGQLIDEYGLTLMITLVPSGENKSDVLTRVPKKWLQVVACSGVVLSNTDEIEDVKKVHQDTHFDVRKTLYLA
ncbi:uncharacterized protein [Watersipora subatra]|uniref:uncharacterized protein n=1 Tax=Watersipora subatra TaxID=2589382 RepID=UPI00355B19DD